MKDHLRLKYKHTNLKSKPRVLIPTIYSLSTYLLLLPHPYSPSGDAGGDASGSESESES